MKSLLWKEFRLCWPILLVGAGLLTAPYLIPLLGKSLGYSVRVDWPGAAVFSLALSILTLTLFGGSAIACERADRSAEFLAYQPIPRGKILAQQAGVADCGGRGDLGRQFVCAVCLRRIA